MLVLSAPSLSGARLTHGFFGRRGGVSEGLFASLNCGLGSGDEPAKVAENRRRVRDRLGVPDLLTLFQVHSANVVVVDAPWGDARPQADAMVSRERGIALGILTADCVPVLLADTQGGVIGAAHAGWKGALAGVVDETVAAMETLGADRNRIAAAIGPCISQVNYEVGDDLRARFLTAAEDNAASFAAGARPGHWQFDLEGFVAGRLAAAGIGSIERLATCTYARNDDFFSFRRATHRGEKDYGRQLSAIALV